MRIAHTIYLGIALIFCATSAHAIVNLKSLHLGEPDTGISGAFDFGLSGADGNSERFRVNSGLLVQHYKPGLLHYLSASGAYGESFGVSDQENAFAHVRRIQDFRPRIAWEVFGQLETNKFARLSLRGLLGGGLRFSLMERKDKQAVFLGTGLFYSHEIISDETNTTDEGTKRDIKGNLYLIFKRELVTNVVLQSTTYFQPVVDDLEDFRVLEDAGLTVKLTNRLNLSLSLLANHDNRPPQSVEKLDITYNTGLQYEF